MITIPPEGRTGHGDPMPGKLFEYQGVGLNALAFCQHLPERPGGSHSGDVWHGQSGFEQRRPASSQPTKCAESVQKIKVGRYPLSQHSSGFAMASERIAADSIRCGHVARR